MGQFKRHGEIKCAALIVWLLTTLCSLIYCPLVYSVAPNTPRDHGGILLAECNPLLIGVIIWLSTGTRPGKSRIAGQILITAGIICAAVPYFNDWSASSAFGDLLIFLSSVCWAIYSVLAAR